MFVVFYSGLGSLDSLLVSAVVTAILFVAVRVGVGRG